MDGNFDFTGPTPEDHKALRYWFGLYVDKFSKAHVILRESVPSIGSTNGREEETVTYCTTAQRLPRPHARHHVRAPARHQHAKGHLRTARLRTPGNPLHRIRRHPRRQVRLGGAPPLQVRGRGQAPGWPAL